jgi:RNA polymerase sigma-54 factor
MKQSLRLSAKQNHMLAPHLRSALKLLQLSTIDLQQEIHRQIESNPMLEESCATDEDRDIQAEYGFQDQLNEFKWSILYSDHGRIKKFSDDVANYEELCGSSCSLQDSLNWQLQLAHMSDIDQAIASIIIDAINDDGFLTLSLSDLHLSLDSQTLPLDIAEIEAVRHRIQRFDPVGCGSYHLEEALLLQLEQLPANTPHLLLTKQIIHENIALLGKHNYQQLMKIYNIDNEILDCIINRVRSLNPKPGNLMSSENALEMVPDLAVKKVGQAWQVVLNPNLLPRVGINEHYASLIKHSKNSRDSNYLKNTLQEARWFLKSLQSRQNTLLKVARFITNYQTPFLEYGVEAMKPLVLNDVADALGMHQSTISRITTQKYIHTPRGLFELKYFFSSHLTTIYGKECSSTSIRALIKKMIAAENHQHPLTDSKLTDLINHTQGVKIARRTVAKYRETMGIFPAASRRSIEI